MRKCQSDGMLTQDQVSNKPARTSPCMFVLSSLEDQEKIRQVCTMERKRKDIDLQGFDLKKWSKLNEREKQSRLSYFTVLQHSVRCMQCGPTLWQLKSHHHNIGNKAMRQYKWLARTSGIQCCFKAFFSFFNY
ncbi:uncharacterized protein LOC120077217 [Benincasa hispida]|uniref:uncharacterized protein LOC120077217 n=1 Tax=Benincasa hispida TaxID=102211 RepID=UPI001901C698|nr:uncharacterized protein LOC120077217 [Benincasa hispida]